MNEQRCLCERHRGAVVTAVHRGQGGTWLRFADIGTFFLDVNGRDVAAYPEAGGDVRALALAFASQVCCVILHARGSPSLHASAVVTHRGAVAFLGPSGRGKSTLAASFVQAEATLLTDDILAVDASPDGVYGLPSLPIMKLGPFTLDRTMHVVDDLPEVVPGQEKKLLSLDGRYAFAQHRARLRAIYVVDRYDPHQASNVEVTVRRLGARESFTTLLGNMAGSSLAAPGAATRMLPLLARLTMAVPVLSLSFPSGFAYQEAVRAAVISDLEGR